jgi:telomerase reverse transcriptase
MDFLRAVFRRIIPAPLKGTSEGKRCILRAVSLWVTAGRRDKIRVDQYLEGIGAKHFPIFLTMAERAFVEDEVCDLPARKGPSRAVKISKMADYLTRTWVLWLLLGFVNPILRGYFYVTDTEFAGTTTVFYRKPAWVALSVREIEKLKVTLQLESITAPSQSAAASTPGTSKLKENAEGAPQRYGHVNSPWVPLTLAEDKKFHSVYNRTLACAPIRLIPKASSLRPITNMSSSSTSGSLKLQQIASLKGWQSPRGVIINKALRPVYLFLKAARDRRPGLMGSSVMGNLGIHIAMRNYADTLAQSKIKTSLLQEDAATGVIKSEPPSALRIFACDVKSAYDCMDQSLAVAIADRLFQGIPPSFTIRSYSALTYRGGDGAKSRFRQTALESNDISSFFEAAAKDAERLDGCIFVDHVEYSKQSTEVMKQLLKEHLTRNMISFPGAGVHLQRAGIPQGSILSTILCNMYLANIEWGPLLERLSSSSSFQGFVAQGIPRSPMALLRLTDDFLVFGSSSTAVWDMSRALGQGFPTHNCMFPVEKMQVSDGSLVLPTSDPRSLVLPDVSSPVFWCGALLDSRTGCISSDYSRMYGIRKVQECNIMALVPNQSVGLRRFLRFCIRPKCQALFLDGHIGTTESVAYNVYELIASAACRYLALLKKTRFLRTFVGSVGEAKLLDQALIHYTLRSIQREARKPGTGPALAIPADSKTAPGAVLDLVCGPCASATVRLLPDAAAPATTATEQATTHIEYELRERNLRRPSILLPLSSFELSWIVHSAVQDVFSRWRRPGTDRTLLLCARQIRSLERSTRVHIGLSVVKARETGKRRMPLLLDIR